MCLPRYQDRTFTDRLEHISFLIKTTFKFFRLRMTWIWMTLVFIKSKNSDIEENNFLLVAKLASDDY